MNNVNKKIIGGLVFISLLQGYSGKAEFAGTNDKVSLIKDSLVYSGDSLNSQVIGNLKINQDVIRILSGNNLDLIKFKNSLGFISKDSLSILSIPEENISYQELNAIGYTKKNVNLRSGNGLDQAIITTLPSGVTVNVYAISSDGWYLVNYNNLIGYISSDYLKIINFDKLEQEMSLLPQISKSVLALTDVNVRLEPNTNSKKYGILKKGKNLKYVSKIDNNWIKVTNGEAFGYVNSNYVKVVDSIDSNYYKQIYLINDSYGYNYPYGKEIGLINKYETMFVYGETEDFYFVEYHGLTGFIKKVDAKELKGIYVVVDVSDQKLVVYNDLDSIFESSVVTGKNETPTDFGVFQIYNKQLNRVLIGQDYQTFVKYWMAFNGGEGFHDASWRGKFGGSIYKKHGSHGCVNMPEEKAKELYEIVSVGNKVLIKK